MTDIRRCVICSCELAPTEIQTDTRCLARTRRNLARIESLYAYLPALLGQPASPGFATVMGINQIDPGMPGGDALAMLGSGSAGGEGRADDPPAVGFELWCWIDDVAGIRGETLPLSTAVPSSVAWLSTRAGWLLSYHPAAEEFVSDVRRILGRLEAVTDTSDAPEYGAPCFECGTPLQRGWTSTGLAENYECRSCGRTYPPSHYWLAVRAQYEAHQAATREATG